MPDIKAIEYDAFGNPRDGKLRCSWCYDREQFTHGEIKREALIDPLTGRGCMMTVCRKHSAELQEPDADCGRMEHDEHPSG